MQDNLKFLELLKTIANDNKTGYLEEISWEGRSPHYSINLENNNHWHDLILLIKSIIASEGEEVDKSYFKRLVFKWDKGERSSLHPHFGARALIDYLYKNIKSMKTTDTNNEKLMKTTDANNEQLIELLKYKKQIILQGPPGTGKTHTAKMIAEEMTQSKILGKADDKINAFFENFNKEKQIVKEQRDKIKKILNNFYNRFPKENLKDLTLENYAIGTGSNDSFCWWLEHGLKSLGSYFPGQSASYVIYWKKDINQYFKNTKVKLIKNDDEIIKEITGALQDCIDNKNIEKASKYYSKSFLLKLLHSYYPNEYAAINSWNYLSKALKLINKQIIGGDEFQMNLELKNYLDQQNAKYGTDVSNVEFMLFLFNTFTMKGDIEIQGDQVISKGKFKIIQFHPAYSYEDFVRGINVSVNDQNKINYLVENRTLIKFAEEALNNINSGANYVLIIDEINRANLPAVLGELIYGLEYRYDEQNPDFTSVESIYEKKVLEEDLNGKILRIPENLYIIGTMNTADRSVGHIDYAIRRRFAFADMLPSSDVIHKVVEEPLRTKALELFNKVSKLFTSENIQPDYKKQDIQLGHSYFLAKSEKELALKLQFEIMPLLKEYVNDGLLLNRVTIDGIEMPTEDFINDLSK